MLEKGIVLEEEVEESLCISSRREEIQVLKQRNFAARLVETYMHQIL